MNRDADAADPRRSVAARLLRDVAVGAMSAESAMVAWPFTDAENRGVLGHARHLLDHYASDGDIRAKDPSYAEHQRAELHALADKLAG